MLIPADQSRHAAFVLHGSTVWPAGLPADAPSEVKFPSLFSEFFKNHEWKMDFVK